MKDSYLNVDFGETRSKLGHRCSQNENSGFGLTVNVRDRLKYGKNYAVRQTIQMGIDQIASTYHLMLMRVYAVKRFL